MQFHHARPELALLGGCGWVVLVLAGTLGRIVERPMFDLALASLHHGATNVVVRILVSLDVAGGETEVLLRHREFLADAIESHVLVALGERQWMILAHGL